MPQLDIFIFLPEIFWFSFFFFFFFICFFYFLINLTFLFKFRKKKIYLNRFFKIFFFNKYGIIKIKKLNQLLKI